MTKMLIDIDEDALAEASTLLGTVAAAAELHTVALVHYDHDVEQIAAITGQVMTCLAPPGSID